MKKKYWDLIVKHCTEETSPTEEKELNEWIKESETNGEMFKKAEKLLRLSEGLFETYAPDTAKEWEKLSVKIEVEAKETRVINLWQRHRRGVAAAVLLLVGIGFVLKTVLEENMVPEPAVYSKSIVYSEPIVYICVETTDSTNVFYLPDSTKIWLNKNSRLLYPEKFVGEVRDVSLSGEAFFEVVGDTANPFIVYAGNTQIKVLGTSFNVKAYGDEDEVEVIVVVGKVEFSSRYEKEGKKVILEVDEKAIYKKKERTYIKEKYEDKGFKWRLKDIGKDIKRFIRSISKKLKRNKKKNKKK